MLIGLKKRQTYDELINELGDDPIKKIARQKGKSN